MRYDATMSGSKQHFIPQSLLKAFGVRRGKSTFVVAYTYHRGIFTPATDGIAAERHFYSELGVEGGDETLDDRITEYEAPLATVLSKLRSLGDGDSADPAEAAALVTHLAVRNDHFRKAVTSTGAKLVDIVANQFIDPDSARALLGLDSDVPQGPFAEQLKEAFDQYQPLIDMLGMDRATFDKWAFENIKSNFVAMHEETIGPITDAVAAMAEVLPNTAANAQRKALNDDLVPARRVEVMTTLAWRVVHSAELLILPDCVAIGFDANWNGLPLMVIDCDVLSVVAMPIASDRLLVGADGTSPNLPEGLNATMAGCAWDFFVARDRTEKLEKLRGALRSLVAPHLDEVIDDAVEEVLRHRDN